MCHCAGVNMAWHSFFCMPVTPVTANRTPRPPACLEQFCPLSLYALPLSVLLMVCFMHMPYMWQCTTHCLYVCPTFSISLPTHITYLLLDIFKLLPPHSIYLHFTFHLHSLTPFYLYFYHALCLPSLCPMYHCRRRAVCISCVWRMETGTRQEEGKEEKGEEKKEEKKRRRRGQGQGQGQEERGEEGDRKLTHTRTHACALHHTPILPAHPNTTTTALPTFHLYPPPWAFCMPCCGHEKDGWDGHETASVPGHRLLSASGTSCCHLLPGMAWHGVKQHGISILVPFCEHAPLRHFIHTMGQDKDIRRFHETGT